MAEPDDAFVLHPSLHIAALHPDRPGSPSANLLLGEVTSGLRTSLAVGGSELLELYTIDRLAASGLLARLTSEDLTNVSRDLRQQLRELGLSGRLRVEGYRSYVLPAMSVAAQYQLDFYTALVAVAAMTSGAPLVLDDAETYNRLRPAAMTRFGLRVVPLSDYL